MVCNFSEPCWMLAVGTQPNHCTLLNISSTVIFHKMTILTSIHSKSMKHTDWTLLHNQHVAVVAHILWTPLKTLDWAVHHNCHNFLWGTSFIVCNCLIMRSLSLNPIANPTDSLGTLNCKQGQADRFWPIFIIGFMRMKFANLSKCFLWIPLAHLIH